MLYVWDVIRCLSQYNYVLFHIIHQYPWSKKYLLGQNNFVYCDSGRRCAFSEQRRGDYHGNGWALIYLPLNCILNYSSALRGVLWHKQPFYSFTEPNKYAATLSTSMLATMSTIFFSDRHHVGHLGGRLVAMSVSWEFPLIEKIVFSQLRAIPVGNGLKLVWFMNIYGAPLIMPKGSHCSSNKRFFVKSLHKMETPPPSPLWSPYLFFQQARFTPSWTCKKKRVKS